MSDSANPAVDALFDAIEANAKESVAQVANHSAAAAGTYATAAKDLALALQAIGVSANLR